MSTPESPLIEVRALSKQFQVHERSAGMASAIRGLWRRQYKTVRALTDVSFTVNRGEFIGVLGKNGAGKTTLLKLLTGLIHPSSGSAFVAGQKPAARHPDFLRRISLVMGNKQQLLWDLPAWDTLRLQAAIYAIPDDTFQDRVRSLSALLGLSGELAKPVRKLSLGERMKAELLTALIHQPDVLFLDEPTLGLDVNAQQAIRVFLKQYNREHGATVVLTSHYMADIQALCPRVLVVSDGGLVFDGALGALIQGRSPKRSVRIELGRAATAEDAAAVDDTATFSGVCIEAAVPQETVPQLVTRALSSLPVTDLSVHEAPLDEIIAALFTEHATPIVTTS